MRFALLWKKQIGLQCVQWNVLKIEMNVQWNILGTRQQNGEAKYRSLAIPQNRHTNASLWRFDLSGFFPSILVQNDNRVVCLFAGKSPFFPGVEEASVAGGAAGAGSPSGPEQAQDVVSRLSAAGECYRLIRSPSCLLVQLPCAPNFRCMTIMSRYMNYDWTEPWLLSFPTE